MPVSAWWRSTAWSSWAASLDWADVLAWLVGDDLLEFADFLLVGRSAAPPLTASPSVVTTIRHFVS